ncbi:MAG: guanylate kinase, partial [Pseudomonadales bacterium]
TLRGQDSLDVIEHRLSLSVQEISHYAAFDFLVVNDAFDLALSQLEEIVSGRGETLKRAVQEVALEDLLASLLS